MSPLMRLWYLSHRRPAKAQTSLHIRAVWPEPSLFAYMKYGSKRRVRPKIRHLALLDGCACTFEEWVYGGWKVPQSRESAQMVGKNHTIFNLASTIKKVGWKWKITERTHLAFHKQNMTFYISLVTRKPVFGVGNQVWHKPACAATEASRRLAILDIETRDIILSR